MISALMAGAAAIAVAQPPLAPAMHASVSEKIASQAEAAAAPSSVVLRGPKVQPLPYDENYSELADPAKRDGAYAKLKYIQVFESSYLTLGGESRTRYEWRKNERFGRGAQDANGNLEQRTRIWADFHAGENLRLFAELRSGVQRGFTGTELVSDTKTIDIAQAFAELSGPVGTGKLSLRFGRQEIGIGGFKLFDMREGPNVRRSFDAVRLRYVNGPWDAEALGGYTIIETESAFDNHTNYDAPFWGARVGHDLSALLKGARIEGLWVHTRRPVARYDAGAAAEDRDTFSLRFNGKNGQVEWDLEGVAQMGEWGTRKVRAGFVTAHASYGFKSALSPRLGLRFELGTGDKNKTDDTMGSYYQLFARPLTINGELGRTNLISFGPTLSLTPHKKLTIDTTLTSLWRTTSRDGIYGAPGQLIRPASDSTATHVGVRATLAARYAVSPFWTVGTFLNHVEKGRFLDQSKGSGNLDYANVFVTFRF